MTDEEKKETVRRILDNHSGGMKLLSLVKVLGASSNWSFVEVLRLIETMPYVSVIKYTWHRGQQTKYFIYTP